MKVISVIFHPLLVATLMSILLFGTAPEIYPGLQPKAYFYFISAILIITCILPAISIFVMKMSSIISSFELIKRTERFYPFAIIAIYYGVAAYLFTVKIQIGSPFDIIMTSVAILIAVLLVISFQFKISVHATAIWGAVGFASALIVVMGLDLGVYYYFLIVAAGLTSSSRLYLGYHSPKEIWSGAIFGFIYSFLTIYLFY
jgi:membrane-associated phospholipid phosphatase